MTEEDPPHLIECLRLVEEHYRHGNHRAELVANLLISFRHFLRQQEKPKSLDQMTTREIIELVDTMFPL